MSIEREREALVQTLSDAGPYAPTLCEGWETADLLAHMVLREHEPLSAAGMFFPPLKQRMQLTQDSFATQARTAQGYDDLLDRLRNGFSSNNPLRFVDNAMNLMEYVVHHEDVRRAVDGWSPRDIDDETRDAIWSRLRVMARGLLRHSPVGVVLVSEHGPRAVVRRGTPAVAVKGELLSLVMFTYGRDRGARVTFSGDPASIEALRTSKRRI